MRRQNVLVTGASDGIGLALARNIEKAAAAERLDAVLAEGRIEADDDAVEQ